MGIAFSLCPGRDGIQDEKKTEYNYENKEVVDRVVTPTPKQCTEEENEEQKHNKAYIIQNNWKKKKEKEKIVERIKVLDSNLEKLGKYITIEAMKAGVFPRILEAESKLKEFRGIPEDRDGLDNKLTFRSPFKFNLDNSIYHGQWSSEGLREGYGVLISEENIKMEGLWREGKLFKGRIFKEDGSYYEGQISENKANGEGTLYYVNGDVFSGIWFDDLQRGPGKRVFQDGYKYEGNFENDQFNGTGTFTFPDGSFYEGNFENSTIKGRGVYKTLTGEIYDGTWNNNLPNGPGSYYFKGKNDGVLYSGNFKNGKKEGNGRCTFSVDTYYEGEWINGFPHGHGFYLLGKKSYKGLWRYGLLVFSESGTQTKEEISVPTLKENFKDKKTLFHLRDEVEGEIVLDKKNGKSARNYKPNEGHDILKFVSRLSMESNNFISTTN